MALHAPHRPHGPAPDGDGRRPGRTPLVPPQHGAWAFLALPVLLGLTQTSPGWVHVPFVVAWVAAYPASWAAASLVRARRGKRFRRPLAFWSAVALPHALILVVTRPWLLWVGAVLLVGFAVNLRYARRNDERAIVNDLVLVAEATLATWLTWALVAPGSAGAWTPPGGAPREVWLLTVVCAAVLVGSVLHVKSLVRERRDPRWAVASRAYAVVCLVLSVPLALAWGVPAGWAFVLAATELALRAFVVGRTPLRPGVIGMWELGSFAVVVAAAVVAA